MDALNGVILALLEGNPVRDPLAALCVRDWVVVSSVSLPSVVVGYVCDSVLVGGSGLLELFGANLDLAPVIAGSVEAVLAGLGGLEPALGLGASARVVAKHIFPGSENFSLNYRHLAVREHRLIWIFICFRRVKDLLTEAR